MHRPSTPRLMSVSEFADALGLSVWTIRQWAYAGRIASNKLGARLMIPVQELDRLITETARPAVSR